jgi:RNA polymerase sigma-70 factor (ECF subfamily)
MYRAANRALREHAHLGTSAEDVVSAVVQELMRKGFPTNVDSLRAFLVDITKKRAIDEFRRSQHELHDTPDQPHEHPDEEEDVEDFAVRLAMADLAVAKLDTLPPRERNVLRERVMRQREAQDVATDLNVTPQRVSQLVNAALARLRALPEFQDLQSATSHPQTPGQGGAV